MVMLRVVIATTGVVASPVYTPISAQQVARKSTPSAPANDVMRCVVSVDLDRVSVKQALDALAASAEVRIIYRDRVVRAVSGPISLYSKQMPLAEALDRVLRGTGLNATMVTADVISIKAEGDVRYAMEQGVVTGTVRDAATKQPLRGVIVVLDEARTGVTTNDKGEFRIANVSPGNHILHARKLSYAKRTQTVTVVDGEQVSVTMVLETSVNALDQVVVTGTVIPTELKAVPNAITVITGKELEERGVSHIYELFRGDVPGLFTNRTGQAGAVAPGRVGIVSRGSSNFDSNGNTGISVQTEGIKTYVDGVELADKSYLGMIDPKSIERIEILTGPQASTIYGSNAISGVMQIFTKRGTTVRPQLTMTLQSAWTQNNFSSALAPNHQADASITGVEGHLSYNSGGSWQQVGSWSPSVQTQTASGFGGGRASTGPLTTDFSLRASQVRNRSGGTDNQAYVERSAGGDAGSLVGMSGIGIPNQLVQSSSDMAAGVTETYAATLWWSHVVTLGIDHLESVYQQVNRPYVDPTDSALYWNRQITQRVTAAYNTTFQVPVASVVRLVVTLGGDVSHQTFEQVDGAYEPLGNGTFASSDGGFVVQNTHAPGHGGFLNSQFGVWDALFVTYGLRAEYNPNVGKDQNPNLQPRYGVALTQTVGNVTVKLRGSYGHSTRPPSPGLTQALRLSASRPGAVKLFGDTVSQFTNPNLLPEQRQGGEGGLEFYLGNHASLVVTHYNETVDDLINRAIVDSVDLLPAWKSAHPASLCAQTWKCPLRVNEFLNLGSIRNQGWEITSTWNLGSFMTRGTYSWNKSRLIGVTPRYHQQFPYYVKGSTFADIPEHTYSTEVAYVHGRTRVAYDLQGQGAVLQPPGTGHRDLVQDQRLPMNILRESIPHPYNEMYPGYALGDLNISHQFMRQLEGLVQIHNVTNSYQSEVDAGIAQAGRATNLGVRLHF